MTLRSPALDKIPATVVTGFLGSGKTTLISSLLRQANGKRIAVIVNEFGDLDVDAELIRGCALENCPADENNGIYELANGCICCTVEEEFLPVMKELVKRRHELDHILIETSGLALPKPLVQAFNWPEIKQFCTVDAVITVVDGPALAVGEVAQSTARIEAQRQADSSLDHDPSLHELLEDQLAAADMVVVSKADQMSEEDRLRVSDQLHAVLPSSVQTLFVRQGGAEASLLMGLGLESEQRVDHVHTHHDHHHAAGREHHHAHDDFDHYVATLGVVDTLQLLDALRHLVATQGIFRIKGFADTGKPMRQVLHVVGDRVGLHFDRLWHADEPRQTRLIFIGRQLDTQAIDSRLSQAHLPH
ncbi:cobalamin biosynthesis protein CobW [Zymobacter sp. IVIA_5232.4 C2]|uniref:cobalamin biosynthesis protein CobW n=1 Tax=Zymobacter sp. IVIA_5232.4 C2 TaxID=3394855 RepID=UPI0039C2D4B3